MRETEVKLGRRQSWLDKPRPKASFDPFAIEGEDGETRHSNEVFYDIVALALQCDATRIMTFQMPGGNGFLPIEGVTMAYHNMTHHGHRPEHIRQLKLVDTWRFQQFASFLKRLKTFRDENDRPLLDSTIVMFGSGMADASVHSSRNTPVLLAGGGFKHGRHHSVPDGSKPYIKIRCTETEIFWRFSIKDNGIGIENQHTIKIFDMFKRLHLDEDYEGTGIGLAQCMKIVRLHNGKIWVESEVGKGSTFFFVIPKKT